MRYMRTMTHLLAQKVIEYEKTLLLEALAKFNGQALAVAKHFKMGRNTLYNRLEYHGINLTTWRKRYRAEVRVKDGKIIYPVGERMGKRKYKAKKPRWYLNPIL